jgi:alkylation response protein AidB-like acyl-CoA dehydrogenase
MEQEARFPRELYREFGQLGVFELFAAPGSSNHHDNLKAICLVCERLARVSLSFAITVSNCADCLAPIIRAGPSAIRERLLPGLLSGELVPAFALSEPSGGSDVAAMRMRAVQAPGGYLLEGSKAWITSAPAADLFILFAKTDPSAGHRGISAFLVPRNTHGLHVGPAEELLGLRSSPVASVECDGAFVPEDCRLGKEGEGFSLAMSAMNPARVAIAACALGAATTAVETAVDYARTRQQFGVTIIDHQGLGFMLADLVSGLAESRALLASAICAGEHADGRLAGLYAAMAKRNASDFAVRAASDAAQILGANGLTRAFPVERLIRDTKALQIFEGTNQIQQWIIARQLSRHGLELLELETLLE